jgi:hypothetical protein
MVKGRKWEKFHKIAYVLPRLITYSPCSRICIALLAANTRQWTSTTLYVVGYLVHRCIFDGTAACCFARTKTQPAPGLYYLGVILMPARCSYLL